MSQRVFVRILSVCMLSCCCTAVVAAEKPESSSPKATKNSAKRESDHTHALRTINARPIIRRLHVPLTQPRRVLVTENNSVIISDWGAGAIVRVDDGEIEVLARDLEEPSGIAFDQSGNLVVSTFAGGEPGRGQIVRVRNDGKVEVIASGLTGATDVEVAKDGRLYVAEFNANKLSRFDSAGEREWTATVDSPSGLTFDANGRLCVTSSNAGKVFCLHANGSLQELCSGLKTPSDIAVDADGQLIAVNFGDKSLVKIGEGKSHRLASVPEGTIAIGYRPDGNFVVLNWELQSATQVRNRISIPCPHCNQDIPVLLKPMKKKSPVL